MKKWKILFLVKAVDMSVYELIIMLNELRGLPLGPNINVYFCITLKLDLINHVKSGNTRLPEFRGKDPNTTLFLKLVLDDTDATFSHRFDDVAEPSISFDVSKSEDVQMFFTLANTLCPSDRNMVVTWDHGKGFGINPKLLIQQKVILSPGDEYEITGDVNSSLLTVEELNLAMKNAFGNKPVDVLLMMNCSMQVVDAGYALRESVNYLVASQVIMNFFGYNYPYIFLALGSNPNMCPRDLAKLCVSSFPSKTYPLEKHSEKKTSSAFFATDLKQYDFLVTQINQLAKHLAERIFDLRHHILRARDRCIVNEANQLIDFYSFLFQLANSDRFEEASHVLTLMLSTKDLIVIESYVGESFKPMAQRWNILPTGFSIYFPFPLPNQPGDFMKTKFYESTQWKLLLESINEN